MLKTCTLLQVVVSYYVVDTVETIKNSNNYDSRNLSSENEYLLRAPSVMIWLKGNKSWIPRGCSREATCWESAPFFQQYC